MGVVHSTCPILVKKFKKGPKSPYFYLFFTENKKSRHSCPPYLSLARKGSHSLHPFHFPYHLQMPCSFLMCF